MKNTNNRSGSVSAVTTKETNLKVFGNKDVAEMSIKVLEDLLDKEKGSIRPYTDGDITHRFKEFLSKEYDPNSFVPIIDRKNGIVYAASVSNKKETIETNLWTKPGISKLIDNAIQNKVWYCSPSEFKTGKFKVTSIDDDTSITTILADGINCSSIAEHICKMHNDWLKFKQKSGEKKAKKVNLRRLKNLAWRMETFKKAFKVIEKNNYLGFASIKLWIEQNEDDVNQWIFTKWLKNSSNYEDWTWFFNNQGTSLQTIPSNEYFELCDSCEYIDYFRFGNYRSMNGVPEGEWDSYTFHQEYESKLFADGKDFTAALVLEKMFEFAEEYVKHTGYITAEMANKYHIDLHLVEVNADSDVLLDKMDPDTANRVRKIVEDNGSSNPKEKNLEQRVDNLEKMVKDIWTNVCADKHQA